MATAKSRRQAVHDFKRGAILEAARRAFAEAGIAGATVRTIAEAAGYSPGAIYAYYDAKEEILGDILADALAQAGQAMKRAGAAESTPEARLRASVGAYYDYYREHWEAFELDLHLCQGARRRPLSAERARHINGRLIALLQVIAGALGALGAASQVEASRETVALFAHLEGVLLLEHGGRLEVLEEDGPALVDHYLDGLIARLGGAA